jgi:hypothetical protein
MARNRTSLEQKRAWVREKSVQPDECRVMVLP